MSKKRLLVSLSVIGLLLVSLHFILQSEFVSDKVRRIAQHQLIALLGQNVSFDGIHLKLLTASVSLSGIATAPGADLPFQAKAIHLYFNPGSLLTRTFFVRDLIIDTPSMTVTSKSLPRSASLSKRSGEDNAPPLIIRQIQIEKGTLRYQHPSGDLLLTGVTATVIPDFKMNRFDVTLSTGGGHVALPGGKVPLHRSQAKAIFSPEAIEIKSLLVTSDQSTLTISGQINPQQPFRGHLTVNATLALESLPIAGLAKAATPERDTRPFERKWGGAIQLQGDLSGEYPHLTGAGRLSAPHLSVEGVQIGAVYADLSYQAGRLLIPAFSGELFSGSFSGKAEIIHEKKAYQIELAYTGIAPEKAFPLWAGTAKEAAQSLHGLSMEGKIALSENGEGLSGEGDLRVKRLLPPPAPQASQASQAPQAAVSPPSMEKTQQVLSLIEEGRVAWRMSPDQVILEDGRLTLPATSVNFTGRWDKRDGFSVRTALVSDAIEKIAAPLDFPLGGDVALDGLLTGHLEDPIFAGRLLLKKWTLRDQPFGRLESHLTYQGKRITLQEGSLHAPASKGAQRLAENFVDGFTDPVEGPLSHGSPYQVIRVSFPVAPENLSDAPWMAQRLAAQVRKKADLPVATFQGNLHLQETPTFDFQVQATRADPQSILSLFRFKKKIPIDTLASGPLTLQGTPAEFVVEGPLTLGKGSLYGEPFDRGRLHLMVTRKEIFFRKVVLKRGQVVVHGDGGIQYQGTFSVKASGAGVRMQESAVLQSYLPGLSGKADLKVDAGGPFSKPKWVIQASLQEAAFNEIEGGEGAARVEFHGKTMKVAGDFPKRDLTFKGEVHLEKPYPFSFQTRFSKLPVDPFLQRIAKGTAPETGDHFLDRISPPGKPFKLQASGTLNAKGEGSHLDKIQMTSALSNLSAHLGGLQIEGEGPIVFRAQDGAYTLNQAKFKGENTALEIKGGFVLNHSFNLFLQGEADLSLINLFAPGKVSAKGKALLNLAITDQWDNPKIRGEFALQKSTLHLANWVEPIQIASLSSTFNERNFLIETLDGTVGKGHFSLSGKATLKGFEMGDFGGLIEITNIRLPVIPDFPSEFTGELLFQKEGGGQTLHGNVTLTGGTYRKNVDLPTVILSILQRTETPIRQELSGLETTQLNIHITGKGPIGVDNNIAKVPLEIDLFLKGTPETPALIGRINIPKGRFYFAGNQFEIASGAFEFFNPRQINPTFDIRSTTRVKDYATDIVYPIDLALAGNLSQFTVTPTSSPPLPQKMIMDLLAGGAVSLAASGALAGPVQKLTGIDRLQVTPSPPGAKTSGGVRLSAEKSLLEDRLRVTTTLDPAREQQFRMVYALNNKVSLIGEKDDKGQIGGNIRFRFEFR